MEKVIHYCWFGGKPLPKLAKKCLRSWKKYLPDFKIIEWNERNFDVNLTKFSKQAYDAKKWAFVSDVARIYALKEFGGIYFDTDMILKSNIDDLLEYDFFSGWESDYNVAAGIIWCKNSHHDITEKLWDYYCNHNFDFSNAFSFSIPVLLTSILRENYGLKYFTGKTSILNGNVAIFSQDYFYPIGSDGTVNNFTSNTKSIHYYIGSWLPKAQQYRFKFRLKYGQKWGDRLLNFLVFGKGIIRNTFNFFRYPLIKKRTKQELEKADEELFQLISKEIENVNEKYIVFYNKNWLGTSIATKELFQNTCGLVELYNDDFIEKIANLIVDNKINLVAFSAFSIGWDKLASKIKEKNDNIVIKVIWHGSFALNCEQYDWEMFLNIFKLYYSNIVSSICFVKKSMYDFFVMKGFRTEFIHNTIRIDKNKYVSKEKNKDGSLKIGLYASGDRWVKNFFNQLAAATLFESAQIDCIPLSDKSVITTKLLDSNIKGSYTNLSRDDLLKRLSQNDINLYVTFTECQPLLPLESLELGVPCITGNNHHYWKETELEKYLVVNEVDNPVEIYNKVKYCLDHKKEILDLYTSWKKENDELSEKSVKDFLTIKKGSR